MKLIFLIILIVFFGGCVTVNDNTNNGDPVPNNGGTHNGGTNNGISVNDGFPSITTSVSPSNPD